MFASFGVAGAWPGSDSVWCAAIVTPGRERGLTMQQQIAVTGADKAASRGDQPHCVPAFASAPPHRADENGMVRKDYTKGDLGR